MFDKNYPKVAEKIEKFIRETIFSAGFSKAIIAVSGGVDSAVVVSLAVRAVGLESVLVTFLPYGQLNSKGSRDAHLVIKELGLPKKNIFEIDIKKTVNIIALSDKKIDKARKGNIMARVRMTYLYDMAKKNKALVCGTENKTEYLLGYFTRFGDDASDIEPIRSLYKTQVVGLAKYLNISEEIIKKAPTAGLWEGQTDEGEFGFTYREADKILYLKYEKNLSERDIIKQGIDKKIVKKVLLRANQNAFKHRVPIVF